MSGLQSGSVAPPFGGVEDEADIAPKRFLSKKICISDSA